MYYEYPDDEALWDVQSQFMFGSQILVSPKVNQKFLLENETIYLDENTITNEKLSPIYEINPILPGKFYDWNTKVLKQEGQYQIFMSDAEISMFVKAGSILPLLNIH